MGQTIPEVVKMVLAELDNKFFLAQNPTKPLFSPPLWFNIYSQHWLFECISGFLANCRLVQKLEKVKYTPSLAK